MSSRREKLPDTRNSVVHKFNINGYKGYMIVGMYDDGRPGELFVEIAKEGSTVGGLCDTIGILTSMALQHGVSLETLVRKFRGTSFEPCGGTTNREIPITSSLADYIFTWMGLTFSESFRKEYEQAREAKERMSEELKGSNQ
ncbi:MAG: hypothetical protein WC554_06445 [Clostridia bacterium]|jgi:ribonucleoside-diphosphate reductase alpha chain